MITKPAFAAAVTLIGALAGCGSGESPIAPPPPPPVYTEADLQGALNDWANIEGHRGVSASVIYASGVQWNGVAGRAAPQENIRPDQLIWIASITKTMTGAIILQLVDQGLLTLNDPIGKWIDSHPNIPASITVKQLLNHTNGLANYTTSPALRQAISAAPTHIFTAQELLQFVGPPVFAPGTRTEYTNTAFILLAIIAERITGKRIHELYHERLWGPLDLPEIFLSGAEPPPGPVAQALGLSGGLLAPMDSIGLLSIANGAWGLFATARNVARWGRALFTTELISDSLQQQMRTLVPAAGNIPGESGAGLGIRGYRYWGRAQLGHSGGAPYGSSLLLFDPTTDITVAVLVNQGIDADHFTLTPRLLQIASGIAR